MSLLSQIFTDYTIRTVALGSAVLGILSGALGSFAVLRRQSLLGDAVSHAALPGVALAFMLTGSKAPLILVIGAGLTGWMATLLAIKVVEHTRVKEDAALGLMLSVFFGLGLLLLTFISRRPDAAQAGLDKFLFGQAAALMTADLYLMGAITLVAFALLFLFWKEFKLLSFDPVFGASLGFPMRALNALLTSLIAAAVVAGLQTVGVVLMSAMLIAPAAAARQWTDRLGVMIVLAAGFGALAGVSGSMISSAAARMPTGPAIVICAAGIFVVSLFFAPNRGMLQRWLRERRNRKTVEAEMVLADLFSLAGKHDSPLHPHAASVLRIMDPRGADVREALKSLEEKGLVKRVVTEQWALTEDGARRALKIAGGEKGGDD